MFLSIEYSCHKVAIGKFEFKLIDSDFVATGDANDDVYVIAANEYIKRNLPVAKNIVLLCIYLENKFDVKIESGVRAQDAICPNHINNWAEIAAERDRLLDKLSAMK